MTVIETHPEELLDRELRGTLNEREHHLLMAHLQRCSACRLERQLRVDFERELAVSAQSLDLQMFVSDAIDAMEQLPGADAPPSAARSRRPAPGRSAPMARRDWSAARPVAVLMFVCVVLSGGVGVGAAQLGLAERAWQFVRSGMDAAFGAPPARPPARAADPRAAVPAQGGGHPEAAPQAGEPTRSAERAGAPAPSGAPRQTAARVRIDAPAMAVEPSPAPPAPVALTREHDGASARSEPATGAPAPLPVRGEARDQRETTIAVRPAPGSSQGSAAHTVRAAEVAPARNAPAPDAALRHGDRSAAPLAPVALPESASTPLASGPARLFDEANRIRHKGQAREASELYGELQARYPNSAEARLSVALVARMQLDGGDSAAALAGFESYLASSDTALREEVMAGRVRALVRLGREEEARSAAHTLLSLYPNSAFAPAAHKLLEPPVP